VQGASGPRGGITRRTGPSATPSGGHLTAARDRSQPSPRTRSIAYLVGAERLELRSEELPAPGPGELLVRIEAATTCGTDLKVFRRGGHPRMLQAPSPFGHEMAGTVEAIGAEDTGDRDGGHGRGGDGGRADGAGAAGRAGDGSGPFRVGDRVVVANSASCGACEWCRQGRENLCADLRYLNGAFAQAILVPRRFVQRSTWRLPGGLAPEVAAVTEPLACVLHGLDACALDRLDAPADIAIYGAGPIGLLFGSVLARGGHRTVVADPNPIRLEVAARLGAAAHIQVGREGGEADRVRRLARAAGGFDVAIEATGSPAAWWDALASVRPGGLVLLFGGCPPGTSVPLDTHHLHYSELTVKSTYHHRPETFRRALGMLARGDLDVRPLLSAERPLAELEAALHAMQRKEALKVVIRP
jgi:L-iditol 2-dehydrogenase